MNFPQPLGGLLEDEDDLIIPALLIGEILEAPDKAAMASVPKVGSHAVRDVRAVLLFFFAPPLLVSSSTN